MRTDWESVEIRKPYCMKAGIKKPKLHVVHKHDSKT